MGPNTECETIHSQQRSVGALERTPRWTARCVQRGHVQWFHSSVVIIADRNHKGPPNDSAFNCGLGAQSGVLFARWAERRDHLLQRRCCTATASKVATGGRHGDLATSGSTAEPRTTEPRNRRTKETAEPKKPPNQRNRRTKETTEPKKPPNQRNRRTKETAEPKKPPNQRNRRTKETAEPKKPPNQRNRRTKETAEPRNHRTEKPPNC